MEVDEARCGENVQDTSVLTLVQIMVFVTDC